MKDLMDRMLVFGPDEEGGGDAPEAPETAEQDTETQEEETFEVEGEKLSKAEVLKRAANEKRLAGEYTRSRQEIGTLTGRIDELSRRVNAQPGTQPAPEPEPNFDQRIEALDPYAPGFAKELAAIQKEQREWFTKQLDAKSREAQAASQGQLSAAERARVIDDANRDVFKRVLADKAQCPVTLTREEEDALWEDFQSHVGKSYGVYDPGAQRFRRNEQAVIAALHAVPSVRAKIYASLTSKARQQGLGSARDQQDATRSAPGPAPRPSSRATFEQQVEYLNNANPEDRRAYLEQNPNFREKFKRYDLEKRRGGR